MADTTVTVNEPDLVTDKNVDDSGRMYVGKDFAGMHVHVVLKEVSDDE